MSGKVDVHEGKVKVGKNRWVSRQRAWQLRMKKEHLCIRCGSKLKKGSTRYCPVHAEAAKARAARRRADRRKARLARKRASRPKLQAVA